MILKYRHLDRSVPKELLWRRDLNFISIICFKDLSPETSGLHSRGDRFTPMNNLGALVEVMYYIYLVLNKEQLAFSFTNLLACPDVQLTRQQVKDY
ncbi:hypothetical protein QFZ20_004592 [Flavobacterium sp. W4I14]|nr:hypothetical protein [Flavobacterium sp. W4I14]